MNLQRQMYDLGRVAAARSDASLAQLRRISGHEHDLRSALDRLRRSTAKVEATDASDPSRFNGVVAAWLNWSDRQQRLTNIQLAKVLAEKAELMEQARQDLGKKLAVSKVQQRIGMQKGK